jgi:tripartite motif-containing protein 71
MRRMNLRSTFRRALLPALAVAFVLAGADPRVARAAAAVAADSSSAPAESTLTAPPYTLVAEKAFGGFGVGAGQLSAPAGVAVDPLGRILIADSGNHRIERFDSSGVFVGEFGGFGYDDNRFDRPTSLFVGGTLGLWVLDQGNARVVKYDLEGRLLGVVVDLRSDAMRAKLGTVDPGGLSADRGGELYITDLAADRVIVFDPLGAVVGEWGGFGAQPGRFAKPGGVAVDARGRLLVGDAGNRRVQLLDSFGGSVAQYPLDPEMTGKGGVAVAFGPDSVWAMVDRASGRIAVRTLDGVTLARWAPLAKGDPRPGAVAFDDAGRLLVTDARASMVTRFRRVPAAP